MITDFLNYSNENVNQLIHEVRFNTLNEVYDEINRRRELGLKLLENSRTDFLDLSVDRFFKMEEKRNRVWKLINVYSQVMGILVDMMKNPRVI